VLQAARAASSKQARRIVILDVSQQLGITDFFLICSGNTGRQVSTIVEEIERSLARHRHVRPVRREGEREARWVVLDYIDFVVHVFHQEDRDYYELERLWSDAPLLEVEEDRWEQGNDSAAAQAT
jgi:ribosome-associated protein